MSDAGRTEAASEALYARYGAGVGAWRVVGQSFAKIALAAADAYDREHGIVRTDKRTRDDAIIGYRVRIDGGEYMLHPSDVDIVRPAPVGAQGEAQ